MNPTFSPTVRDSIADRLGLDDPASIVFLCQKLRIPTQVSVDPDDPRRLFNANNPGISHPGKLELSVRARDDPIGSEGTSGCGLLPKEEGDWEPLHLIGPEERCARNALPRPRVDESAGDAIEVGAEAAASPHANSAHGCRDQ
jgi:hypothetical protein